MIETARRLIMGLAMAGFFSSCRPINPPQPPQQHCPEQCPSGQVCVDPKVGCIPKPPAEMPEPGVPVKPEMLLRQSNAQLIGFKAFMAIPCCMQFTINGQPVNSRWPLASEEFMDYTGKFGANFFHFRFGPFYADADHESEWSDIGGPYLPGTLDWNPKFWQKTRELQYHALKNGWYVELNPIDTWYCKHAASSWGDQQMPWPQSDIDACGIAPSPEQDRYIRKVVHDHGCFGNGVFTTDNEGGQIPGSKASWYTWVHDVIRDEEQKSGCGFVHMIGTNSDMAYDGPFDYLSTHSRSPLASPLRPGSWSLNNEHNPAFSPEEEAGRFEQSRKAGQAWGLWRAEMSDAQFDKTLTLFQAIVNGGQAGCFAPDSEDPGWKAGPSIVERPSQTIKWLNAAKVVVGDPKNLPGETVWDRGLLALDLLAQELRKQGYCASGPWADSVVIQATPGDGMWEEMHAIAFTDGGYAGNPYKNVWIYQK